ncbi:MAG: hypothetical protein KAJ39_06445 [Gammaproteobacteria bacterium]|nr:hypothetical protein [Gammaproteobacteria bacterium]
MWLGVVDLQPQNNQQPIKEIARMADKGKYETTESFELEATAGFEIVLVDEGVFDAEVTSIVMVKDVEVVRNDVTEKVDMLRWTFSTPDGLDLPGTSSTKFGPKSKAFEWAGKILGREIQIGEVLKPSDLKGKQCQVVIKNSKKEVEFAGKKEIQESSTVHTVLTAKKKSGAEKPATDEKSDSKGK